MPNIDNKSISYRNSHESDDSIKSKANRAINMIAPDFKRSSIIGWSIAFLVLILPWIIVFFPGIMSYDLAHQISMIVQGQYIETPAMAGFPGTEQWTLVEGLSIHHPIFVSWLYGGLVNLSGMLFTSSVPGIVACLFIQASLIIVSLSVACCYLSRLSVPPLARIVIALFLGLCPLVGMHMVMLGKDALFSGFFLLWFIGFLEVIRTRGAALSNKKVLICFIALGIFCGLTRKAGALIILISLIVALFVFRKHWKKILLTALLPVFIVSVVVEGSAKVFLGATSDASSELLALPFNQTAAYVTKHGDEVTEEEKAIIDSVLLYDNLSTYHTPGNTDPIKQYAFRGKEVSFSDLIDYLQVYFQQSFKHPETYWNSLRDLHYKSLFLTNSSFGGYETYGVILDQDTQNYLMSNVEELEEFTIPSDAKHLAWLYENGKIQYESPGIPKYYGSTILDDSGFISAELEDTRRAILSSTACFSEVPVLGMPLTKPFYVVILPLVSLLLLILCQRKRWLLMMVPVVLTGLMMMVSPLDLTRYIQPLIYVSPLVFAVALTLFLRDRKAEKEEKKKIESSKENSEI